MSFFFATYLLLQNSSLLFVCFFFMPYQTDHPSKILGMSERMGERCPGRLHVPPKTSAFRSPSRGEGKRGEDGFANLYDFEMVITIKINQM